MIDVEALDQHGVLRGHHVVIVVLREVHAQTVGRFARFAVPDVVRKNDVELRDIEGLAGAKEHVGKHRVKKGMGITARAMEQQDCVISVAGCVLVRLAQSEIVELQLRDRFTATEVKVTDDVVTIQGRPVAGLSVGCQTCERSSEDEVE
jgi:hypothetical protein